LRLFDVLRGTHWTLLGYAADCSIALPRKGLQVHLISPSGELRDSEGTFTDAYGLLPGEWVLIRPDGHVAAVVAPEHIDALYRHFERHAC